MKLALRLSTAAAVVLGALTLTGAATAADKQQCLDAAPKGQELRDQGKLVEARAQFVICADAACPDPVPKFCGEWLDDLKKKLPSIVLRVSDATGKDVTDAIVTVDDRSVTADGKPIDVDPGSHRIHVARKGARDADQTVVAALGEHARVVAVKLEADAAAPATKAPVADDGKKSAIPLGSWIGWGVGAAGLIGFGVFGVKANMDFSDYQSSCGHRCGATARDDVEGTMVVADVFLAIGIAGAAVGTVLYLLAPPSVEQHARSGR